MDIVVTGRHCTINPELKELVHERIATVERLRDRVIRAEVDFTADDATKDPSHAISVQLTLRSRGPVVRAEAKASDKTAAFEMA
ncbi:MAG TPA: ribosome-associated translation inhibitor RaiA, partial [Arachnia sp.]|nr:ribosome-associated translation inhibitor RaiA [Arachnia sp.]